MKSTMITGLTNDQEYGFRVFPRNPQGQLQTRNDRGTILATPKAGIPLANLAEGAVVMIPEGGVPAAFYLAKHSYEAELNGPGRELMVRKDCYGQRAFNSAGNNAYAGSSLDNWLSTEYKSLFSQTVQTAMALTQLYSIAGNGSSTVNIINRTTFILALCEYTSAPAYPEGEKLPVADQIKTAYYNGVAKIHWTRTPWTSTTSMTFAMLQGGGYQEKGVKLTEWYVRPAFTLPSDLVVGPVPNADGSYNLVL